MMAKGQARRKQAALAVPADRAEAIELLAAYRAAERQCLIDRIVADEAISELKRRLADLLSERDAEQKVRFAALKAWWEAGGKELAGKKRSAELAGTSLGVRLTPPAVKFAKGVTAAKVIAWLKTVEWSRAPQLLRTKVELDKAAIIKSVADSQGEEDLLAEAGVTVVQTDEFFIDTQLDEGAIRTELGG